MVCYVSRKKFSICVLYVCWWWGSLILYSKKHICNFTFDKVFLGGSVGPKHVLVSGLYMLYTCMRECEIKITWVTPKHPHNIQWLVPNLEVNLYLFWYYTITVEKGLINRPYSMAKLELIYPTLKQHCVNCECH